MESHDRPASLDAKRETNDQNPSAKVALVTGGAKRIGAKIAEELHLAGFSLIIHYGRSSQEAVDLTAKLNASRPQSAVAISADLRDMVQVKALAKQAMSAFHRIDLLVNNASSFYATPLSEVSEQQWEEIFSSNLKAPFFLSQALADELRTRQGNIVNIVDIYAERPLPGYGIYSMAKSGLAMMTKVLAQELGPEVRVNGVAPGAILHPSDHSGGVNDLDSLRMANALQRIGNPKDIAQAVLFLAESAPYVTGQILAVDGGRNLNI